MKTPLLAALAVFLSFNALADSKITFEMAAQQDADARVNNNSVNIGAFDTGMSADALEGGSSGDQWKQLWKSNCGAGCQYKTTSVKVPSSAKEVYIEYNSGPNYDMTQSVVLPSTSSLTFAYYEIDDRGQDASGCVVSAKGIYSGFTVTGQRGSGWMCSTSIKLLKVMYK